MDIAKKGKLENKMGTMPINKLIINMSLPLITSMFVQAFYNIVDSLFVARINEEALTAVSMSFPAQNLMISAGTGVGVGITALIARYLGAKDEKGVTRVVHNGIFLGILNSILFAIFGIFFAKFYFEFQKASGLIETYGIQYLSICSIFAFSIILEITFERMLMALYFNIKKNHEVRFAIKKFAVHFKTIANIYEIGFPSIVMQSAASFMIFQLNNLLASFSTTATAVLGVYFKLQSFVVLPVFGLNNSVISIVSYNYGAGKIKRLLKAVKLANIYAFGIMFAGFVLCQTLPVPILKLFDASDNMLSIGIPALRIISFAFLIAPFSIVSSGTFQALGKGIFSLIVSLIRQLIVILPLSYLLAGIMGINGVWIAFPMAEIVAGILTIFYLKKLYQNEIMKRKIKRHK